MISRTLSRENVASLEVIERRRVVLLGQRDYRWGEEAGELEPPVAIRRAHHGDFDALIAESSNTAGPFSFNRGLAFELETELAKEINRRCEVIDDDSYVIHPFERHVFNLREVGPFWTVRQRDAGAAA